MIKVLKPIVVVALVIWGLVGSWQCLKGNAQRDKAMAIVMAERLQKKSVAKARWDALGVVSAKEMFANMKPTDTISIQRAVKKDAVVLLCGGSVLSSYLDPKTGKSIYRVQSIGGRSAFRVTWELTSEIDLLSGPKASVPYAPLHGCRLIRVTGPSVVQGSNSLNMGNIVVPASTDGREYDELDPPLKL